MADEQKPQYAVFFDKEKVLENASIPGSLAYPIGNIARRSAESHRIGQRLRLMHPNDPRLIGEDPDNLQPNTCDLVVEKFLRATRAVNMKGSEQVANTMAYGNHQRQVEGDGVAPNLSPRQAPKLQPNTVTGIAVAAAKDTAKDPQVKGALKKWAGV